MPARRLEEATRGLRVAKAQLDAAETRLAQRDETLRSGGSAAGGNAFEVRAPIAGTVVAVSATPGAAYEEGIELFRIVRTDRVGIEAHVPPSALDLRGQVADVALEMPGDCRPIPARILGQGTRACSTRSCGPSSSGSKWTTPTAACSSARRAPRSLYLRESATVPVVPAAAILTEAGRPFLFVQVGGESFERRNVELGARDGDRVAVTAGVKAGERVVTRGTYDVQLASAAKGLPAEGHVH